MNSNAIKALAILFIVCLSACNETQTKEQYLRWVGDIEQDEEVDDPNFTICNGEEYIKQYFNLSGGPQYLGEKPVVERLFAENYQIEEIKDQSGWLRIRFIVNCEGKAGRYRLLEADQDYKSFKFNKEISARLLELTKSIESWPIQYTRNEKPIDYYYYLTFKLKDGQIQEIIP